MPCDYIIKTSKFNFLEELKPNIIAIKSENKKHLIKKHFLISSFERTLPNYSIRKRLKNYFEFYYSGEWENNVSKTFPVVLFICPTKAILIYAKRYTLKLLEENQDPDDLHIRFATVDDVKQHGVTSEIWEEAE